MKILWLTNILMPAPAKKLGLASFPIAGWINGLFESLLGHRECELILCAVSPDIQRVDVFLQKGVTYVTVPASGDLVSCFAWVLEQQKPDIVHLFGTEGIHAHAMAQVAPPARTIVQIQGFLTWSAPMITLGIPLQLRRGKPLKRLLGKLLGGMLMADTLADYERRAVQERALLSCCHHVLGHTQWDVAIAQQYAPNADYHSFNETLRADFYEGEWSIARCKPYSIFVSQAMSPIKSFHMLLQALPELIQAYPGTHVYVAGSYPVHPPWWSARVQTEFLCEYYGYIRRRIRTLGLENHITFLGALSEAEMKRQYLSSNVFVSCSSIENESNSLSEAKMLGVPCVASYVGGVTERITHGESGFFYPFNEVDMLRYYVGRIFEDPELARRLSAGARREARITNDPVTNASAVIEIYREVLHGEEVM